MVKKVLFLTVKYAVYLLVVIIMISVLAKTGNMPAAVPKETVRQIIETTDKLLIRLKLIRDEKIISKYYSASRTGPSVSLTGQEQYHPDIFFKTFNFLFQNNYETQMVKELNRIAEKTGQFTRREMEKLASLANSSYVNTLIQEQEAGIVNNSNTVGLLYNIILPVKEIRQMFILDNKNRVLFQYGADGRPGPSPSRLLAEAGGSPEFKCFFYENRLHLLFQKNTASSVFLFLLSPDRLFLALSEGNSKGRILLFPKDLSFLYTAPADDAFEKSALGHLTRSSFRHGRETYRLKFLKAKGMDLHIGLAYPRYPLWKIALNILKLALIIAAAILAIRSGRLVREKIKSLGLRKKPSPMDLITGAMLEVAKSVKSSAAMYGAGPAAQARVNFNPEELEKVLEGIVTKHLKEDRGGLKPAADEKNQKKKDPAEWKFIEPF